jgi:hypothetical protein
VLKVLNSDKDTYITDRVINNARVITSNVGAAGSLDLFKLYGLTSSGSSANVELSRLLIHFNLQPLRDLITAGLIDTTNPSFNCKIKLFDVYGGQPTPNNFTVSVYPLSRSFDEGLGRDVVAYSDVDVGNFMTASSTQVWLSSGAFLGGGPTDTCDYITGSAGSSLKATQVFVTGEEDLSVDVTTIVSATIANILPDRGFRISYDSPLENDNHTYFVKRFGSRSAFNEEKRPRLIVKFDDSIQDDTQLLTLDSPATLVLYNYTQSRLANLLSASNPVTGSNCLLLELQTPISGGSYSLFFTGSQHKYGTIKASGIYSASVSLSSLDSTLALKLRQTGSIPFTPIWTSLDKNVTYLTSSIVTATAGTRTTRSIDPKKFVVSVLGLQSSYGTSEKTVLRINIFDYTSPLVTVVKRSVELPGIVVRDVHYQIRDVNTQAIFVPFDTAQNSTRASSDSAGMFFSLDTSNLTKDRLYTIDVMIVTGNNTQIYKNASPVFRVTDLQS